MAKKLTTEEFIAMSKTVHGNKYDYSVAQYTSNHENVKIICPKHGIFEQRPSNHLQKRGCPNCAKEDKINRSKNAAINAGKQFAGKAAKIHNNKYDYAQTVYVNNETKVVIICPKHGAFEQTPVSHLRGKGCKKCQFESQSIRNTNTTAQFIAKANLVHGAKYDYSNSEYLHNKTRIEIVCNKHGVFKQTPTDHLQGHGCPTCNESRKEILIAEWLSGNRISYQKQVRIKEFNPLKSFDFYLPDHSLYIEYDGELHFMPVYGNPRLKFQQERDQKRNKWCKDNNVKLLVITYLDNWERVLESNILNKLG